MDVPFSLPTARPDGFLRGLRDALPLMVGFVPFALVLGTQATARGFHDIEVLLMAALDFGGGSEFAALGLWTAPPQVLLIAGVTLLVNSRHLLMGATLVPWLRDMPRRRALAALFLMCDESWALSLSDTQRRVARGEAAPFCHRYYMGASLGLYFTYVAATTTGAVIGPVLGDITRWGLDMAFPAVFLALLRGMWKGARTGLAWGASLIVAACVHRLTQGAWYVPAGVATGLLVAWAGAERD